MAQVLGHGVISIIFSVQIKDIEIIGMYFVLRRTYSVKCISLCECVHYIYIYIHVCMYVCMHACMYDCVNVFIMYVCVHACVHVCMYACVYIYTYTLSIYIHIHLYIFAQKPEKPHIPH